MGEPIPIFDADPGRPDPGPTERTHCPQCGKPLLIWPNLKVIAQYRDSDNQFVSEYEYDLCTRCHAHLWLETVTALQLMSLSSLNPPNLSEPIAQPEPESNGLVDWLLVRALIATDGLLGWLLRLARWRVGESENRESRG